MIRRATSSIRSVSIMVTVCIVFGVVISVLYAYLSTRKNSIILDPESRTAFAVDTQPYLGIFSETSKEVNTDSFRVQHLLTNATLALPDYIGNKLSAEIQFVLQPSPHELSLRIPCVSCSPRLPDASLYVPGIEYRAHTVALHREGKDVFVYADRVKKELPQNSQSVKDVVPMNSAVFVTDDAREHISFQELQNPEVDFLSTPTEIPFQLEGDTEFYVRAGTQLTLYGTKINSNSRTGTDGCVIQVLDLDGNVIAAQGIADDGNTQGDRVVTQQVIKADFSLPTLGIVMVRVRAAQNSDFVLSGVRLNTNRVSFEKVTLHVGETAYAHIDQSRILTLTPVRQTATPVQIANVKTGATTTVALDTIEPNTLMRIPLESGTYTITAPTTLHLANASFAGTATALFSPFMYDFTEFFSDADAVVTTAQVSVDTQDNAQVVVKRTLDSTELQALQSTPQEVVNLQFVVRPSPEHKALFTRANMYSYREVLCGGLISIYSALPATDKSDRVPCDDESLRETQVRAVNQALPVDTGVTFDSHDRIGPADFFAPDAPEQYSNATQVIDTRIQGSSRFALYSEGELNIDILKQELNAIEGSDEILVTLTSAKGEVLFSRVWTDSGDRTPSGIVSEQTLHIDIPNTDGISFLEMRSLPLHNPRNDIRIPQVTLNTNIVMLEQSALFYAPTTLYVHAGTSTELRVERVAGYDASAYVNIDATRTVALSSERPVYTESLTPGVHTITSSDEGVRVGADHLAFSQEAAIEYSTYRDGEDALVTDVPAIDFKLYSGLFSY